jgi:hypothetical protein
MNYAMMRAGSAAALLMVWSSAPISGCSPNDANSGRTSALGVPIGGFSAGGSAAPAFASAGSSPPIAGAPSSTPFTGTAGVGSVPPIKQPVVPTMMVAGSAAPPAIGPTSGSAAPPQPQSAPGPDDGDPNQPVVMLSEVACKQSGGLAFGAGANFKVDDRDVIIDYPCGKHEGAPMTFILNLHGTTPVDQHFYQEGYFSAFKYVASHNLIIATPSSVVQQWGNGDNGQDLPYLMHVIDWVYKTLGSKFDIRSMWVGGHSWGAFYTAQFGCKPELADKVRGLIIMSGSPSLPACASKMSIIDTNAEMDIGPPLDQGMLPMQHGCKAAQMNMLGNNTQTLWPDCTPKFVHSNYLMLGKMHIDFMDDVVVKSIVDLIKQARP